MIIRTDNTKIVTFDEIKGAPVEELMEGLNQENIYMAKPYLNAITLRKDEFEPLFLARLKEVSETYQKDGSFPETSELLYMVLLLTKFQTKGSFEAIFNVFNLNDDDNCHYWGDYTTEYLSAMLYRTCSDFDKIKTFKFSNKDVIEYIRGAVYDALIFAYVEGDITRDEIINVSSKILDLGAEFDEEIASCMCGMLDINLFELKDKMIRCFDDLSLEETMAFDKEEFSRLRESCEYDKKNTSLYSRMALNDFDDVFTFMKNSGFCGDAYKEYQNILANTEESKAKLELQRLTREEQDKKEKIKLALKAKKAKENAKKVKAAKKKNRKKK